jgi:hypothetical protein
MPALHTTVPPFFILPLDAIGATGIGLQGRGVVITMNFTNLS